jgi:hypothetical protein
MRSSCSIDSTCSSRHRLLTPAVLASVSSPLPVRDHHRIHCHASKRPAPVARPWCCSGDPLHPGELGRQHQQVTSKTIRLAGMLGVEGVVMMSGCPGGLGDATANWVRPKKTRKSPMARGRKERDAARMAAGAPQGSSSISMPSPAAVRRMSSNARCGAPFRCAFSLPDQCLTTWPVCADRVAASASSSAFNPSSPSGFGTRPAPTAAMNASNSARYATA